MINLYIFSGWRPKGKSASIANFNQVPSNRGTNLCLVGLIEGLASYSDSTTCSVRLSAGPSVGPSIVRPTLLFFAAPVHPHATKEVVYPALFTGKCIASFFNSCFSTLHLPITLFIRYFFRLSMRLSVCICPSQKTRNVFYLFVFFRFFSRFFASNFQRTRSCSRSVYQELLYATAKKLIWIPKWL